MSIFKIIAVEYNPIPPNAVMRSALDVLVLIADDGRKVELSLSGECCSSSYFEEQSVKDVKALVGQTLLEVEPVESNIEDRKVESTEENDYSGGTYQYHGVKLSTDKETIVVDWRNESNGYYDGTCKVTGWTPKKLQDPYDYDYTFRYADLEDL